jgi:hypothetical protein
MLEHVVSKYIITLCIGHIRRKWIWILNRMAAGRSFSTLHDWCH